MQDLLDLVPEEISQVKDAMKLRYGGKLRDEIEDVQNKINGHGISQPI